MCHVTSTSFPIGLPFLHLDQARPNSNLYFSSNFQYRFLERVFIFILRWFYTSLDASVRERSLVSGFSSLTSYYSVSRSQRGRSWRFRRRVQTANMFYSHESTLVFSRVWLEADTDSCSLDESSVWCCDCLVSSCPCSLLLHALLRWRSRHGIEHLTALCPALRVPCTRD